MKKLISKHALVVIAAGGMLFTSCGDHDMFNPNYKKNEYAANWETKFGKIDPAQDWSMATTVKATVNLGTDAKKVVLYTGMPGSSDVKKLAMLNGGQGSVSFDYLKGASDVYAVAYNVEGKVIYADYFSIENAQVNISETSVNRAKTRAVTRAAASLGEKIETTQTFYDNDNYWDEHEGDNYKYWYNQYSKSVIYTKTFDLYKLNNIETKNSSNCKISDIVDIVGKNGVFAEAGIDESNHCNKLHWEEQLQPSKGAEYIIESESPVEISYMFGGTVKRNIFGYLYYTDGATEKEILTAPRYILMNDASPQKNVKADGQYVNDGMQLPGLVQSYENSGTNPTLTGTTYKLTYFGVDGKGTPSDKFPAGTHIVFFEFIDGVSSLAFGNIRYSLPWMNKYYYYKEWPGSYLGHSCRESDTAKDFVTYKWGDQIVLGMEDEGGDCDMNDILFFVKGDFKNDIPQIGEEPDPAPELPQNNLSWILACEDLGSTDDYDFNDIVLEVKKNVTNNSVEVRCLAAGGTIPAYITYNDVEIGEAHALLGGQTNQMINTNSFGAASEWQTLTGVSVDMSIDEIIKNISIRVTQNEGDAYATEIKAPEIGEAPQMIIVPGDWEWPAERKGIETAYPEFTNWSSNASLTDWNRVKVSDKVVKR